MAANELPCAPSKSSAGPGAIFQAITKEERKAKEQRTEVDVQKGGNFTLPEASDNSTKEANDSPMKSDGSASGDDHVDIPLNTPPASDDKEDPMEVTQAFEEVSVTEDGDSEGHRTPRQSNGTFSNQLSPRSQSPSNFRPERPATSSTAAWSDIVTAAVDHSDEHVTKSAQPSLPGTLYANHSVTP